MIEKEDKERFRKLEDDILSTNEIKYKPATDINAIVRYEYLCETFDIRMVDPLLEELGYNRDSLADDDKYSEVHDKLTGN